MDFLHLTKYGNTVEAYLVSIAIFVASFFGSRWVYGILRRTLCEWVCNLQNSFEKQNLYRLANLVTYLIPIAGFYLAKSRLSFTQEVSVWLNIAAVVAGQIVLLLFFANILEPVAEVGSIRVLRDVWRRDHKYLQAQKQSIEKIKKHVRGLMRVLIVLLPGLTIASNVTTVPTGLWIAPLVLILLELAICFRIILVTRRSLKKSQTVKVADHTSVSAEISRPLDDPDLELKETIVKFFLDIYKHRLRALKDSPAEFRLLDYRSFAPNYIYELRAMKDGDWQSRRMTIGPIGEDTGSRSKCFYVIYDYHLVIKIPPTPINDLNKYMDILKKERRIVKKLSMKECIIPSASVILQLIQRFTNKADLPPEESEDDYIKLLNTFSELQRYLKIGKTFAFFMDLSKYYFLGHIIQTFHDTERKVNEEISNHSEVLGDYLKFEDRFGDEYIPFFLEVEKLYTKYDSELKNLLKQFNISTPPSRDQIKKWFFIHLVGDRVTEVDKGLSAEFIVALNRLVDRILNENFKAIQTYREHISKSIHEAAFTQNKLYMEGIVTNLLELLAQLSKRRVAMRDLKPDNLLVAGNRDKYPGFLAYPQEYKIGLIDVETAVILSRSDKKEIDQPPLGGTPQYATLSHFFNNNLLRQIYDDLPMVLHLQDWYGIIAIIYRTVTGLPLFEQTAGILPNIIKAMREHKGRELEHFHNANETFWKSAVNEFREKIAQREEIFRSLNISILDRAKEMFREFALDERRNIADEIHQCVFHHNMPMSAKDRQFLGSCSYEKTKQLRKKWESRPETRTGHKVDTSQIVSLLRNLEELKLRLKQQTQLLELSNQSTPNISAYELLEYMFSLVLRRMYTEEWVYLIAGGTKHSTCRTGETSSQTTIAITSEA